MATSNEMMRPVILSRPENTALGLAMRCGGGATTTSSPGCGEVSAGSGVPRGWRMPGSRPGVERTTPCGASPCGGNGDSGTAAGAATPPGGGAKGCD